MSMSTGTLESRASRLAAVVSRTRLSFVATVLAAGLLLACAVAIVSVACGLLLDLAAPLSVPGRVAVVCGWWAAVAVAGVIFVCLPAGRRPVVASMALRIERALGGIQNRLLTVVDLARPGRAAGFHTSDGRELRPELVSQLLDQTQDRMRGFRASQVLPWRAVLRNLLLLAAAAAVIAALYLGLGERFVVTLRRLLDPTADIPPATWLQLESPGDLDVLAGEPFAIEGRVVRSVVGEVDLVFYDTAGRASRQPMRTAQAGTFTATLEGLDEPCRYRLEGGNTWTKTHDIRILKRPEILAVTRRVRLPDYMRIPTPLAVEPEATQIRAPVGATAEFEVLATAEAVEGDLTFFERALETTMVERFDERVWFEDDLPRDAVSESLWKWTTADAAGGLRCFTFAGDARPLSMRTKLEPLVLPRDRLESRAVMVMARIDAVDPPTKLSMLLDHQAGRTELVWGAVDKAPPGPGVARVAAGPLPAPGSWSRLTAPLKSAANLAGQTVTGVTFSVDRGRILLDRPGWVERSEEAVTQPVDTRQGAIPLARIATPTEAPGLPPESRWLGEAPVAQPVWASIELRSAQGHANRPAPPVEIVPTIDAPPSIVVDKAQEVLTLKVADDVPIRGRGFDDWGIDAVSVLIGPDPEHLAEPAPLSDVSLSPSPPPTELPFASVLTTEMLGIGPGKSAAWKLRIRDTKGQIADTPVFRVTVLTPPESELAKTQVPSLAQARRRAEQLAKEAEKRAEPLDARQETVRQALAVGEQPEKKSVDEIAQRLDQERRLAEQLAQTVEKAAGEAAKSDLVPQAQREMLADLAAEAQALEQRLAGRAEAAKAPAADAAGSADEAPQAAVKPEQTPAEIAAAAKAERVAVAPRQQQVAAAAEELASALQEVEQRLDAHGAALQLGALAKDLAHRAERLTDRDQPGEKTPAQKQATRQQIRDVEQILGQRFPDPKPATSPGAGQDPPHDTPPTPSAGAPPQASQDAPPQASAVQPAPSDASPPATEPTPTAAAAAGQAATVTARLAARLADQLAGGPGDPPDALPSVAETPQGPSAMSAGAVQELLESREVQQALTMAERARRLQERAAAAAAHAEAAAARRAQPSRPGDQAGPAPPGNGGREGGASTADGERAGTPGQTAGGAQTGRTDIDAADALRGLDAKQRAALYKLPPRIRDPLLEGMRQRGPAAYQDVIDTYFRQLGKDIPQ
jgi:hypothetical protein